MTDTRIASTETEPTYDTPDYDHSGPAPTFPEIDRPSITSPESAFDLLRDMAGFEVEQCHMLVLDTKHRLIERVLLSIGTVDHTFMAPREVYRAALLRDASAIVLAHNHPSGDSEPSPDDRAVTRRLSSAGDLLGVRLLDHLVIGNPGWASLARAGAL